MEPIKKRKALSVGTKQKILKLVDENNHSYQEIASLFNCSRSTIADIVKKRKIFEHLDVDLKRKKLREGKNPKLEAALIAWIKQMRSKGIPLSGNVVKDKALDFSVKLDLANFTPNDGWLDRFKKRHGLVSRIMAGEKGSVSTTVTTEWTSEKLPKLLENYNKADVFNLDETALFYKLLPDKTLHFKNDACIGGKRSKERITILVGSNAEGTEKLPLLAIGKSAKPHCFKNVKTLPVEYYNNKKAWMTHIEWENYIKKLDKKFVSENRKVIFLADKCPSHFNIPGLQAIKLAFLPPNTTAIIQPMDQGVIRILKCHYRELVIKKLINALDNENDTCTNAFNFQINLLDAIHFIKRAWDKIKPESIQNCFVKAGFYPSSASALNNVSESTSNFDLNLWGTESLRAFIGQAKVDLNDYITVDDNAMTSGRVNDDDILKNIEQLDNIENRNKDSSGEEDEMECTLPSAKTIDHSISVIRLALSCAPGTENEIHKLYSIENKLDLLSQKNLKQYKLTDYFRRENS